MSEAIYVNCGHLSSDDCKLPSNETQRNRKMCATQSDSERMKHNILGAVGIAVSVAIGIAAGIAGGLVSGLALSFAPNLGLGFALGIGVAFGVSINASILTNFATGVTVGVTSGFAFSIAAGVSLEFAVTISPCIVGCISAYVNHWASFDNVKREERTPVSEARCVNCNRLACGNATAGRPKSQFVKASAIV